MTEDVLKIYCELSCVPVTFTGIVVDAMDNKYWFKDGKQHKENGPAVEWKNGSTEWLKHGLFHREDGPAVEFFSFKEWWIDGKKHRIDGPAVEWKNGAKYWYLDGEEYIKEIKTLNKIFLGKEKGKYGLEWLKFLTEEEIEEYPILPGLNYEFCIK